MHWTKTADRFLKIQPRSIFTDNKVITISKKKDESISQSTKKR
ncbi:hypothetical protein MCERE19_02260 [Spirosomataceae bacterium]